MDYLKSFLAGKTFVALGNLDVKSLPEHSVIFIDDPPAKGYTNRSFVLSVGPHVLKVRLPNGAHECVWRIEIQADANVEEQCR